MVGGTFGNGQQTTILMTIPEQKCDNFDKFLSGACSPCSIGKKLSKD
jgi:hypothetical protein